MRLKASILLLPILLISCGKEKSPITDFASCAAAGNPVLESFPRQCKTPDGKTFVSSEDIVPEPAAKVKTDTLELDEPLANATVGTSFAIRGKAKGWYFEGSFPVLLLDRTGKQIAEGNAVAKDDWMTDAWVAFEAQMDVPAGTPSQNGILVLRKDNASGEPANDTEVSVDIVIGE